MCEMSIYNKPTIKPAQLLPGDMIFFFNTFALVTQVQEGSFPDEVRIHVLESKVLPGHPRAVWLTLGKSILDLTLISRLSSAE